MNKQFIKEQDRCMAYSFLKIVSSPVEIIYNYSK